MPERRDSGTNLTPETAELLRVIIHETEKLKEIDFADIPPANVFEAGPA
jgi:hypothetical protein